MEELQKKFENLLIIISFQIIMVFEIKKYKKLIMFFISKF